MDVYSLCTVTLAELCFTRFLTSVLSPSSFFLDCLPTLLLSLPAGLLVLEHKGHQKTRERRPSRVQRLPEEASKLHKVPFSTPRNVLPSQSQNEEYQSLGSRLGTNTGLSLPASIFITLHNLLFLHILNAFNVKTPLLPRKKAYTRILQKVCGKLP